MPWLRLLGQPALGHDHDTAIALERKDAALLALLALGGSGSRSLLAAWLWPDAAPRTAAGSLRQRIFRLRRRLGHPLVLTTQFNGQQLEQRFGEEHLGQAIRRRLNELCFTVSFNAECPHPAK